MSFIHSKQQVAELANHIRGLRAAHQRSMTLAQADNTLEEQLKSLLSGEGFEQLCVKGKCVTW